MSFFFKEPEDKKKFKIRLRGNDTEKVYVPSYGDNDQDKTLLSLIRNFYLLIEDGDLFKEDEIGSEESDRSFTSARDRDKLVAIKEVYRKFRFYLKGEVRDTWLRIVEDQPILAMDSYAIDNTDIVLIFERNQKSLIK